MLEKFTTADFTELVNQTCRLHHDALPELDATLVEARELSDHPGPGGRKPFSLMFRAPAETPAEQGIYRVEHPRVGTLEMFLVPIGADDDGLLFEAVFT